MNEKKRRAVIIAAGRGSRLETESKGIPKSLLNVGAQSIIRTIVDSLARIRIEEVLIVTGYKHEMFPAEFSGYRADGPRLVFVKNDLWEKKNGVSVLSAKRFFVPGDEFLLLMSDHLFSDDVLKSVASTQLLPGEVALGVDDRIDSVFDLDDATKVRSSRNRIVDIGKEIPEYDGIDCGIFKCSTGIFDALQSVYDRNRDCSLTDGGRLLIERNKMVKSPIGDGLWIDIDTPEALEHASRIGRSHWSG
jgi:1L-myo-inositol 1-phosphate cytidylyltransferase